MMQVKIIEPALFELDDSVEYYNAQDAGLGKKFLDEVFETIELIKKYPQSWPISSSNIRKAVLRKYPFNLIYTEMNSEIFILAVAHQNRKPEYWINRDIIQ